MNRAMRRRLREHLGRDPEPSAGIIVDSQSAKTTGAVDDLSCGDLLSYQGIEYRYLTQEETSVLRRLHRYSTYRIDTNHARLRTASSGAFNVWAMNTMNSIPAKLLSYMAESKCIERHHGY